MDWRYDVFVVVIGSLLATAVVFAVRKLFDKIRAGKIRHALDPSLKIEKDRILIGNQTFRVLEQRFRDRWKIRSCTLSEVSTALDEGFKEFSLYGKQIVYVELSGVECLIFRRKVEQIDPRTHDDVTVSNNQGESNMSRSGFLTKTLGWFKRNASWALPLITAIILVLTLIVQCTNFNSLNRPFVEIAPVEFRCDLKKADPQKEGANNRFCEVRLRIENYGPIPAFDMNFQELTMGSKSRGYFSEKDPWYKSIRDFKRGWLSPKSREVIGRGMRFVIADDTIRKYNDGEEAFEVNAIGYCISKVL